MPPTPAPPPVLMEELVEQILLRIPSDDPATLVRAALVCKPWCRLLSGRCFRRRFRKLHGTPPMLGFCYVIYDEAKDEDIARFAPTTSFNPPRGIRRYWQAFDSRHGRVLLHDARLEEGPFVIWNPITDEKQELPVLPRIPLLDIYTWSAAVFCAAIGKCDHLDCQRGAFNVVLAGTTAVQMFVYVYSSEVGAWSLESALKPGEHFLTYPCAPGALVGNALYFSCFRNTKIIKYELGTREISWIDGPPICSTLECGNRLITTEDGRLGVAYVIKFKLHIWSSEVGPNKVAKWTPCKVIELATLPPLSTLSRSPRVIGSADNVGIILLWSLDGLFVIDLKSGQVRKIFEERNITGCVIPFMSFYTPALGNASTGEVPSAGS